MTWSEWAPLFAGALTATVFAFSTYLHWSWRYQIKRLGLVSEVSFLVLLVCAGWWAIASLWVHRP